jgi:hypothetical protein
MIEQSTQIEPTDFEVEESVEVAKIRAAWSGHVGELPDVVTLRSGAKIDPRLDHWTFVDGVTSVSLNYARLPSQVAPLIDSLKRVLIHVLEENSPNYAVNLFGTFGRLASVIAAQTSEVSEITEAHVSNYIAKFSLGDKLGLEAQLSALLGRWSKLHYSGLSDAAVTLLAKRKKKGNTKGEGVLTFDPVTGPLTEFELQQLITELNGAYATRALDEQFYHLAWLAILTGQRVSQYCALKVKDLQREEDEFGELAYSIKIPKAKQRGEVIRDTFHWRPLNVQFGESLWRYAQDVSGENPTRGDESPLFPSGVRHRDGYQINPDFDDHWNANELTSKFQSVLAGLAPISPRTFEPMNLAVGRFRDTLGTRSAQEGFGELVIAEILGHSDTQNVGCYVAAIPEIAARLDKQLAKDLAPIAHAFMGVILIRPEDATRASDPSSQIVDYRHTKKGVGSCGTKYDCTFNAPVACYTCKNFEAWLDAPHGKLLDHLLRERERLLVTSGPRVAAINDTTIVAVQRVVEECQRIKSSLTEAPGHD